MFREYLSLFGEIIPEYIVGDELVKKYFRLCIHKRMKPGEAIQEMGGIKKKQLDVKIIKTLEDWSNPDSPAEYKQYELVKEFDRWNNFRILPEAIREPSAYKRRVKNNFKRRVKMMGELSSLSIQRITELCKANNNFKPRVFLPVLDKRGIKIIPVKGNPVTLELLTEINLYVFTHEADAKKYIESVRKYLSVTVRECTDGLEFWPIYREQIKKAINYEKIQKIAPTRKYLEMAMKKLQYYNHE
jgi:hypothetical protein